jgi:hypothetical protein
MATINTANNPKRRKIRFISTCLKFLNSILVVQGKLGKIGPSEEKRKGESFIACPKAAAKIRAIIR